MLSCQWTVPAIAAELGTLGGMDIRLDTDVRASAAFRTVGQSATLLDNVNGDDGDRAFGTGPISERLDVATTLDATRGDLGFEVSADGWYDAAYHQRSANDSPATFNPATVGNRDFPADVRELMGATVELDNAYVRDKVDIDGLPVSFRIGRQTLLWGESLFFAQDGIAGAQAPIDLIKLDSQPLAQAREVYLPVSQADLRISLPGDFSLGAYDQFEWRRDRIPGVGSYFSTTDILDVGGQRIFAPGGGVLFRARDETPSGIGQFGVALRRDADTLGLGLYALRYDAKSPQVEAADNPGLYRLVYPKGIGLLGISASTYIGDNTLSGEVSFKDHNPLASLFQPQAPDAAGPVPAPIRPGRTAVPGLPTGKTLQVLASLERTVPPGRLWGGATLQAELAATELLATETGAAGRLPHTTPFALAVQTVFTPAYYHLGHDVRLSVPVGIELGVAGRSAVDAGQNAGTGNVTVGVVAFYRSSWRAGLFYTRYLGPSRQQPLADRDNVKVSIVRTF